MPGLIGYLEKSTSSGPVEGFLGQMATALEPDPRYVRRFYEEQGVGIGLVSLEFPGISQQPVWNDSHTICALMEGEVFNTKPLRERLQRENIAPDPQNGARLLLQLYETFGEEFVGQLNGAFLLVFWDPRERKITLMNDRLGLHPLYYAQSPSRIIFGSGVRAVLADDSLTRTPDPVAMAQFLTFDHMLGDRTNFQEIKLLPQGVILTFQDDTYTIRKYSEIRYPDIYEHISEEDLLEELQYLMDQAIVRQNVGDLPMGMLLSGGTDSRVILAYLMAKGTASPFHTFTWGIPGCDDARISNEVARKLNTQHHFFELKPDYLLSLAEEAVRITDGLGNILNLHALATLEEEAQYARVIFKGFLGDAMFGFAVRRPFWAEYDPETAHEVHVQTHSDQGVINYTRKEKDALFSESFLKEVGSGVFDAYKDGMAASNVRLLASQRLFFDFTQRVPRMTLNGVEVVRSRARVRLPFCDNDLVDFSMKIPPGFHFERYLMRTAFARAFPDMAKIPLTDTGLPMIACAREVYLRTINLAKWHLNQRGFSSLAGPSRRPYKDYNNWFRKDLKKWIEANLLNPQSLDRGYFQPETVKNLVAEHMAGVDHTIKLGGLLTIELWHQQFID